MLFFLYGEDSLRSSQKLAEFKTKFMTSGSANSGLSIFNYDEKNIKHKSLEALNTPNLLAPQRLVIFKNLEKNGSEEEQERILNYLKENKKQISEAEDLIIVFWEAGQSKKNNVFYKFLLANSKEQNFEKLVGMKLNKWVLEAMHKRDPRSLISDSALEKLILFCSGDTQLLANEIRKLVDFSDGHIISEQAVEKLVKSEMAGNIFEMVDALGDNQKKNALKLLHRQLKGGEDPFYIFSMFVYQFRNLAKIADLKERFAGNENEISKTAKMHPFIVRKSLAQTNNFSFEKLKKIYRKLSNLDAKIKTGKIDIGLALDKFIIEL